MLGIQLISHINVQKKFPNPTHTHTHTYLYIDMANVMSMHHIGDVGDEPPKHSPIVPGDCESAMPLKKRYHSKSLIVYQLFNKLGHLIPI